MGTGFELRTPCWRNASVGKMFTWKHILKCDLYLKIIFMAPAVDLRGRWEGFLRNWPPLKEDTPEKFICWVRGQLLLFPAIATARPSFLGEFTSLPASSSPRVSSYLLSVTADGRVWMLLASFPRTSKSSCTPCQSALAAARSVSWRWGFWILSELPGQNLPWLVFPLMYLRCLESSLVIWSV